MATFVKHPDTNEMLPAEASGRIRPGDELVDINGHSVEGLNVEEAMALIRDVRLIQIHQSKIFCLQKTREKIISTRSKKICG